MKLGLPAVVAWIILVLAACGGSARPAASSASVGPSARGAEITLSPVQPADSDVLAAAAGVIRRRGALLGLRNVSVAVSGQGILFTGPRPSQSQLAFLVAGGVLGLRPVLLEAPDTGTGVYGDAHRVNAATMKLFGKLVCGHGPSAGTVNDGWKATVGYSAAEPAWANAGSQIVSCDAAGTRYVLSSAAVVGSQVKSVSVHLLLPDQWVVDLTLDDTGSSAFGALTTSQYKAYYLGVQTVSKDDQALDSTAIVLDGNVLLAPATIQPVTTGQIQIDGPGPAGFTRAAAQELAELLQSGPLPVGLRVGKISG